MQKKLNRFIRKDIEMYKDTKFIERLTFEQLKRISVRNNYYLN